VPVGFLPGIDAIIAAYPRTLFEFGIQYKGEIQVAIISSWNRGMRVTLYPFFLQGDSSSAQIYGTTVFTRGLDDQVAVGETGFRQLTYRANADGTGVVSSDPGGTGPAISAVRVFVRPLVTPWIFAGTFATFDTIRATYPNDQFEMGFEYNGFIQRASVNTWGTAGMRVSSFPFYPQGDTSTTLIFGNTIFLRGNLANLPDTISWWHRYYRFPSLSTSTNGNSNTVGIFVRRHINAWQPVGAAQGATLSRYNDISSAYPSSQFELGIALNGDIQPIFGNGWNRGQRLTLYPLTPMGNDANALYYGLPVLMRATDEPIQASNPTLFYLYYFSMNVGGTYTDGLFTGSSPVLSSTAIQNLQVFFRPLAQPWTQVGTLSGYDTLRLTYPDTKFEFGMAYNGGMQAVFFSNWTRGVRTSLYPIFPTGDTVSGTDFGTATFLRGLDGLPQPAPQWYHIYCWYPNRCPGGNNGDLPGNNAMPLHVRPHSQPFHALSFGV
jgi:hypothetical protein